ncbi:uncharacterized protein LACBIDRAFT_317735 [Laccaria bicolor S238N-H82]|uniref:Predicted protein n=1 Tax=Laccaria bicolor (strain S238N-H82 / ATCC MYA-4686) TaxID=486041 RepID=B0E296_LACBS|nr:uncharacterized protein LACBIDRAFT_317735 [Laccaria bicolor S238N-H82]EDQ99040.1 predicted protein [Laccaria bicolor S238N-H82]|eukprot:XP_001890315.1 predicted protein [Laccaria bicolor S238N-H82]
MSLILRVLYDRGRAYRCDLEFLLNPPSTMPPPDIDTRVSQTYAQADGWKWM